MSVAIIEKAKRYGDKIAIIDQNGEHSYTALINRSKQIASFIQRQNIQQNHPICFLIPASADYVHVQWAIWLSRGVATPLCVSHPTSEMEYVIQHSEAQLVIASRKFEDKINELKQTFTNVKFVFIEDIKESNRSLLPIVQASDFAMMLFTSGTTNRPKGVITRHNSLQLQMESLIEAWQWKASDRILHFLPLHHLHGILNKLCCALYVGATVEFIEKFDASKVFDKLTKGNQTVFMAVPTIYKKLLDTFEQEKRKEAIKASMKQLRLMVSGSAALPVQLLEEWEKISGHYLLERYGMTEIGMGISNPYDGERRAGHIGQALPGISVRLMKGESPAEANEEGEIQVKGPSIFDHYWRNEHATKEAFTHDGWFKTGDIAIIDNGYYKILGRSSVDIIKSGGYKVSALEIEEAIRSNDDIQDVAVVGVPDDEWGERIVCAYTGNKIEDELEFKRALKRKIASYKVPQGYLHLDELPRNVMGKVTKMDVKKLFSK